ncbi:hypothetical protein B0J14DRAFT_595196 [Halenospora varia]|nr:hypothetical protein B0J14DRAFT_595196 [Halenospora varia]
MNKCFNSCQIPLPTNVFNSNLPMLFIIACDTTLRCHHNSSGHFSFISSKGKKRIVSRCVQPGQDLDLSQTEKVTRRALGFENVSTISQINQHSVAISEQSETTPSLTNSHFKCTDPEVPRSHMPSWPQDEKVPGIERGVRRGRWARKKSVFCLRLL